MSGSSRLCTARRHSRAAVGTSIVAELDLAAATSLAPASARVAHRKPHSRRVADRYSRLSARDILCRRPGRVAEEEFQGEAAGHASNAAGARSGSVVPAVPPRRLGEGTQAGCIGRPTGPPPRRPSGSARTPDGRSTQACRPWPPDRSAFTLLREYASSVARWRGAVLR